MKLALIVGLVGLIIAVGLTVFYFSLAKFFAANAGALKRTHKRAEQIPEESERTQPQAITGAAPQKIEYKATAKAGR